MLNCEKNLERIHIVLVDTQDGANIGSVCRAMKTMGITNLDLVTTRCYDEDRVRTLALHASDIWENAKFYKTLEDALKNSVYVIGSTRRRGRHRKLSALSPDQLVDRINEYPEGIVSIVFGREADGLRDDEVAMCSEIVTIPTSDSFPSLNLSQAVQIITYSLFKGASKYPSGMVSVSRERSNEVTASIMDSLTTIGYFKQDEEEKWTRQFLRDLIERAHLSESEVKLFQKLFNKTEKIKIYKDFGKNE